MSAHTGNPAPGVGGTAKDGGLSTGAVRSPTPYFPTPPQCPQVHNPANRTPT